MPLNPFITNSSPRMSQFCDWLAGKIEEKDQKEEQKDPSLSLLPSPSPTLLPTSTKTRLIHDLYSHFPSLLATVDATFSPSSLTRESLRAQLSVLQGVLFPSRAPLSPPSEGPPLFSSSCLLSPPSSFVIVTEGGVYFYAGLQPFSFFQAFRFKVGKGGPRVVGGKKGGIEDDLRGGIEGGKTSWRRSRRVGKEDSSSSSCLPKKMGGVKITVKMEYDTVEEPKIVLTDYKLEEGKGVGVKSIEFEFRTVAERDCFVGVLGLVGEMGRMKEELGWVGREKEKEEERRGELKKRIREGEGKVKELEGEREGVLGELGVLLKEQKELLGVLEAKNKRN